MGRPLPSSPAGRSSSIDTLLSPLHLPVAGIHSLARRNGAGTVSACPAEESAVRSVARILSSFVNHNPGLLLKKNAASSGSYSKASALPGDIYKETMRMGNLDLGLIGNCGISALVDKCAKIVWCCLPRYDGDPVFHQLLGSESGNQDDGAFSIELEGFKTSEQFYVRNTAILKTILLGESGSVEVTDFIPRFHTRNCPFRPQTLIRRVLDKERPAAHPRQAKAPL